MANLQIELDDRLRDNARLVATEMGLDLATAVRMFLTQMVRERALPFRPFCDPFHSPSNQAALQASLAQLEAGQTISKTLAELESMAE